MAQQFTEKEVLELGERLNEHQILGEKLRFYAGHTSDQELTQLLNRHYQTILHHSSQMVQALQQMQQQTGWGTYSQYDSQHPSQYVSQGSGEGYVSSSAYKISSESGSERNQGGYHQ